MILRNPPSGYTRLRLHDLSFYSWYDARRTLVSKTMNRAPVTIAKWSTCASTWTRPEWPLLERYVRPCVYLPTCICLTLTSTPFSPDFAAQWKKKSERKRERKTGGRPVCAVAAGYSGSRHWFRSTGIFRWVARCQGEHPRKVVVNYISNTEAALTLASPAFVWCGIRAKRRRDKRIVCVSFLYFGYVFAGCSKNRIFLRGKARCTGESRSRGRDLLIRRVSWYVGFDGVGRFFFFFFSLFESCVVLSLLLEISALRIFDRGGEQFPVGRFLQIFRRNGRRGFELLSVFVSTIGHWRHSAAVIIFLFSI